MAYLTYDVDVLKVGAEQVALGSKVDPKAAVSIMLKNNKELAEVFEDEVNIAELVAKTAKLFKEHFKSAPKPKTEKVTPKTAKPTKAELAAKAAVKVNKKAGKSAVSVAATPTAKAAADSKAAAAAAKLTKPAAVPDMK